MASLTAYQALRDWLAANWVTSTIVWENEPAADISPDTPAPWILAEVTGRLYQQASIGAGQPSANRWREDGALLLHIMVPSGTGSTTARTHAETLANALRGMQSGDLSVRDMSIGDGRVADDDGAWWTLTLRVEWERG